MRGIWDARDQEGAGGRGIWQLFPFSTAALVLALTLALAFLLSGATFAEDVPPCLNCEGPSISTSAAWWWASTGETPNTGHFGAVVYGETPLAFGQDDPATSKKAKVWGRAGLRISFQQAPGQSTTLDPTNFQAVEFMPEYMFILSKYEGVKLYASVAGWIGQKLLPSDVEPVAKTTWGWGAGFGLSFKDGSWVDGRCGQSDSVGANPDVPDAVPPSLRPSRGIQCRSLGTLVLPKTQAIGTIVFDLSASLFGDSPNPQTSSTVSNVTFLYGVAVDAMSILDTIKGKGSGTPTPRAPEVARPPASPDASMGPPAPRGRWS